MATLVLDPSGANISLNLTALSEGAPLLVGDVDRAFDLSSQSCARGEIRTWPITTEALDTTTKNAIRTLIALQVELAVTGDMFGGSTITVIIKDNGWSRFAGSSDELWQGSLVIEEAVAA
jgi:hypothetical protein